MSNRILIVTEFFYPEQTTTAHILTKIATSLSKEHEICVISGPSGYNGTQSSGRESESALNNIRIIRLNKFNLDKNNLLKRAIRFIWLSVCLTYRLKKNVRKDDSVLIVTNPAPLLLFVSWLKKFKSFSLTVLVHDIFPENTLPAGLIKSERNWGYRILKRIFDKAYASADRLIALGEDMQDVLFKKIKAYNAAPDIHIIGNWADIENSESNECIENKDKIVILYAGNIGRVQGFQQFFDIWRTVSNKNIRFRLRGNGALVPLLKRYIQDYALDNIDFGGRYMKAEQFAILANCDICLVSLAEKMYGLGVPSKTYNILQAGKPILFIGDPKSEIGMLVKKYGIGYCFSPNQRSEITRFLETLSFEDRAVFAKMGAQAKQLARTIYSENVVLEKYNHLFKN